MVSFHKVVLACRWVYKGMGVFFSFYDFCGRLELQKNSTTLWLIVFQGKVQHQNINTLKMASSACITPGQQPGGTPPLFSDLWCLATWLELEQFLQVCSAPWLCALMPSRASCGGTVVGKVQSGSSDVLADITTSKTRWMHIFFDNSYLAERFYRISLVR